MIRITIIAFACLLSGCSHSHRVVNAGTVPLTGVDVRIGKYTFGHGHLAVGKGSGYRGSMAISGSPLPVLAWFIEGNPEEIVQEVSMPRNYSNRHVEFILNGRTAVAELK